MSAIPAIPIVVALLVACLTPPLGALVSPSLAQEVDPPASSSPPSTAPSRPPAPGSGIALNFEDADIETVTRAVSEIVGFSYIVAPDVRGKVTIRTAGAIRRDDVFSIFLSILEVHGFTAVKAGNVYKIVRIETARERAIPTFIPPPPTSPPPRSMAPREVGPPAGTSLSPDLIVTQVFAPRFGAAAMLAGVIRPLVSSRGSIIADPTANVLIVTDTAANVVRVAALVTQLDVEVAADELHVIRLQYADASDLASVLNHVFAGARLVLPPVIAADRRTNSLIIRARRADLEAIERLLGHD